MIAAVFFSTASVVARPDQAPPGYRQILPRGRIAAIDQPEYVDVEDAKVPGDAWVLGFRHGPQAYAYSLNLLNVHEVVNDRAGDQPFAAVW